MPKGKGYKAGNSNSKGSGMKGSSNSKNKGEFEVKPVKGLKGLFKPQKMFEE